MMPGIMSYRALLAVLVLVSAVSCQRAQPQEPDPDAYNLGIIGAFGELVNSGVKKLALSEVLPPADMDRLLPEAQRVAARNHVQLYREPDLLVTDLFPADVAKGKDVLLIYQGTTKDEYLQLKADARALEQAGQYSGKAREAIARRFGRMLSYPVTRINELLAGQTGFRTMRDFGIRASNLFLYYRDLDRATAFYRDTLGLELVADYQMATIFRITGDSYLVLVDATKGMHTADEPKSVALALVTDQLDGWHAYLATKGISPRSPFAPAPGRGSAHARRTRSRSSTQRQRRRRPRSACPHRRAHAAGSSSSSPGRGTWSRASCRRARAPRGDHAACA
jgi:catechol 2,3-dioxygenase-like lactoylglutathione lyase family enzyme